MARVKYPWKRFWCPRGGTAYLDDQGYLLDPELEDGKILNPTAFSSKELSDLGCVALRGDPGSGKTTALEEIVQEMRYANDFQEDRLIDLNLRAYGDENRLYRNIFECKKFERWINSTYVLSIALDSLDECLLHNKTVATMLVDEFKKYPISRLRLRIACRAAEWPLLLSEELPRLWGTENYMEVDLLPLRSIDVLTAAQIEEIDTERFFEAIQSRALTPFAMKPITLIMLLEEFQQGSDFPSSPFELYHRYCLKLCYEPSLNRRDIVRESGITAKQLMLVAERIAALSLLSKRPNIYIDETGAESRELDDITISELVGGYEVAEGFSIEVITQIVYELLRSTDLFTSGQGMRRCWGHWSYAEYLAARFLRRHQLTCMQLSDLLFSPEPLDGGYQVIPPLAEVAAWTATFDRELFNVIAENDPQVLLRSPFLSVDSDSRRLITASLLKLFEEGKTINYREQHTVRYDILNHASLDEQLRPYIIDRTKNTAVRRAAIDIAEACQVRALLNVLVRVAIDSTDDYESRVQAAHAIVSIGDELAKQALKPLLSLQDEDKRDALKGCTLQALWPNHLSADELFANLTNPKRENYLGVYWYFVSYELGKTLTRDHLLPALTWVKSLPKDHDLSFSFRDLIGWILRLAWQNLDDDEICDSFAAVVVRRLQDYDAILGKKPHKHKDDPPPINDVDRLNLAAKIISLAPQHDIYPHNLLDCAPPLFHEGDLDWLINRLRNALSHEQKFIAKLICLLFNREDASQIDKVLLATQKFAALAEECTPLFEVVELASPRAEQLKHDYELRLERQSRRRREPAKHPPMPEIVANWLSRFEAGETNAWWRLNLDLTLEPHSDRYSGTELNSDLTSLPGWQELDDQVRERCVRAAYRYLLAGEPNTSEWLGTNTFHRPASAGYRALLLLQKLSPDLLDTLPTETWQKWAAITIGYPELPGVDTAEAMENIVARTYRHAPNEVRDATLKIIDHENAERGRVFVLNKLERCWDDALASTILEKLRSDELLKPKAVSTLLGAILSREVNGVKEHALSYLSEPLPPEGDKLEIAKHSAALLLVSGGEEGWQTLQPLFERNHEFGKEIVMRFAYRYNRLQKPRVAKALSERSLADLYIWVTKQFPYSQDPPDEEGVVGPLESVIRFRDELLTRLRETGTLSAYKEICRIADKFANDEGMSWLRVTVINARQIALRKSWHGHEPRTVLLLAENDENRLVESGEQLLDVVMTSLSRLEDKLQHTSTPAVDDLWNENHTPKGEDHLSNYVKRHLEDDLKRRGIIANREVVVRKGQRTDIHVQAIVEKNTDIVTVVVETKGCWNREIKIAMKSQLQERYLEQNSWSHGIYLVGWYLCNEWDGQNDYRKSDTPKWSLDEAKQFFRQQAEDLSEEQFDIRAFVINTRIADR